MELSFSRVLAWIYSGQDHTCTPVILAADGVRGFLEVRANDSWTLLASDYIHIDLCG